MTAVSMRGYDAIGDDEALPSSSIADELVPIVDTETGGSLIPVAHDSRRKGGSGAEWEWVSRRYPAVLVAVAVAVFVLGYAGEKTITNVREIASIGGNAVPAEPAPSTTTTTTTTTIATTPDVPSSSSSSMSSDTTTEPSTEAETEEIVYEITIPYTLTRKGYAELPYFKAGASTITTYKFLEGYEAVIEPHVDMGLTVYQPTDGVTSYAYTVCSDADSSACYSGTYDVASPDAASTVNVPCEAKTPYTMTVEGRGSDGSVVTSRTAKAMCMYVRREMREYTEADLDATMDAMHTLWTTTDTDGHSLYGANFHSAKYFSIAHDFNAGQRDADHIHQGLGFVPQHLKLTNMFEASMQAVNQAVTMPYWDFTRDVAEGKTIYDSVMFSEKTFGSITQPTSLDLGFTYTYDSLESTAIQDGRWAFLKSEIYDDFVSPSAMGKMVKGGIITQSSGIQANAFGYMRGPWNMNPSPYISRFTTHDDPQLPTCYNYYYGVQKTDFLDFLQWAPYGPHAATHAVVGGVYGCDKMNWAVDEGFVESAAMQQKLCAFWGVVMKELYRGYYIDPNSGCSASSLAENDINCGYTCNADKYPLMYEALKPLIVRFVAEGAANADHTWSTFRDFICKGDGYKIFVGDHLESASTSDPSFWPGHPTLERLVQLKYMTGVATGFTWPTSATHSATDVCDAPTCYETTSGVTTKSNFAQCCYGHNEYDQLLDFVNRDTSRTVGPTNHDMLFGTDPTSDAYSMPYIYNHFAWDHCEEDFEGAMREVYSANQVKLQYLKNLGRQR